MARQNTSYLQKSTPRRLPGSPKSTLKRSPTGYNGYRNKSSLPSFSRFGPVKAKLDRIHEESSDQGVDTRLQDEAYREFHTNEFVKVQQDDESEDEDDMADWDEETTVVAMLQNELGESEEDRLSALVDNLKTPITAHGLTLKQHLVQTLVPTAKQVKSTHAALETKVDVPFEAGLLEFNDASRTMENLAIKEEDDLKIAYAKSQNNIKNLFTQLEQAYIRRDQIFNEFHETLDKSVQLAKADLATLPGDVERTITALDKKSKDLEKDTANVSAKSKERMLRELLNKF